MNLLFLVYFDINDQNQIGVTKKINYQLNAMHKLGHVVDLAYCTENKLIIRSDIGQPTIKEEIINAPKGASHYRSSVNRVLRIIAKKYDVVLIRYPGSIDYYLFSTIKYLSGQNIKVVLELPTYPIGGEMLELLKKLKNEKQFISLFKRSIVYGLHMIFSRRLNDFLSCILSYSEFETIWNVPVINIENGIDLNSITPKKNVSLGECVQELKVIFVASFSIWHGVDRLIKGLYEYYLQKTEGQPDITVLLVGKGAILDEIVRKEYFEKVKEHIIICGPQFGHDLDVQYDVANIAVSSLGMHRIGLKSGSTLKTREYCAKGIPFIYAYNEKGIDDSFPYALKFAANEDPIDFNKIIDWYKSIDIENCVLLMRQFAKKYDWAVQIKKMFDYLEAEKDNNQKVDIK